MNSEKNFIINSLNKNSVKTNSFDIANRGFITKWASKAMWRNEDVGNFLYSLEKILVLAHQAVEQQKDSLNISKSE